MPTICRVQVIAAAVLLAWGSPNVGRASTTVVRPGTPYTIEVWETEDGLPQSSVIALTQTRDGYLWLGTLNGLARFDGFRFTVFDEANTPGLESGQIVSLFEDSQRNLWLGTETRGAALVQDGQVKPLDIGRGSREGRLVAACEDASGGVWLYTADGQLCRHQAGVIDVWHVASDPPSSRRFLVAERDGPMWIGSDTRIQALDPARVAARQALPLGESRRVGKLDCLLARGDGGYWCMADGRLQIWRANRLERDLGPYAWGSVAVSTACEDSEGNLVVGTLGAGLFLLDPEGRPTNLSINQGLSHNWILSLLPDPEGNVWVGTDGGGLNRVKRQALHTLEASTDVWIKAVCVDPQGGVWLGSNGRGAGYWHRGAMTWYGAAQGLSSAFVPSVLVDREGKVWAGTVGAGLFELDGDRFVPVPAPAILQPVINALFQDKQGRLWVAAGRGLARRDPSGWKVFTTREGLSSDNVRAVAQDARGDFWIATAGGGLNRLHDDQPTVLKRQDGLPADDVASLWVDADEVLWVGTRGGGLGRFQAGRWTRYTTREGLVSNSLGYVLDDGQGHLWIGSNAGLMRVPKQALTEFAGGGLRAVPCRTFGRADGLPSSECSWGSQPPVGRSPDGALWFPTLKGVASVLPGQIPANLRAPPVMIESVLVDGVPLETSGLRPNVPASIIMPAEREQLEIHFTSLNLTTPQRARFRYRLEGHETDWVEAGNDRAARYSRLPPGNYQFRVTACNEDGPWSPTGSVLALVVKPPFWRTTWFLTVAPLGLLAAVVGVVYYGSTQRLQRQLERMRQQQAVEKERGRIARDLHDQLGASLTQIALLGEMTESDRDLPQEVEGHARQITQSARDTTRVLDEIVWAVNPSNDTLEGLANYVCKHAQDYLTVAGLRHRLDMPAELPATALPPDVRHNVYLAAKEAVTNVVRHAQAKSAWIRLRLQHDRFVLEIADDGRGLAGMDEKAAAARNGLRNMRKRLEDVGGQCEFLPAPEGGALVRLTVPLSRSPISGRRSSICDPRSPNPAV